MKLFLHNREQVPCATYSGSGNVTTCKAAGCAFDKATKACLAVATSTPTHTATQRAKSHDSDASETDAFAIFIVIVILSATGLVCAMNAYRSRVRKLVGYYTAWMRPCAFLPPVYSQALKSNVMIVVAVVVMVAMVCVCARGGRGSPDFRVSLYVMAHARIPNCSAVHAGHHSHGRREPEVKSSRMARFLSSIRRPPNPCYQTRSRSPPSWYGTLFMVVFLFFEKHITAFKSKFRFTIWQVRYGMVWYDMVGMVWYGMVWYGMVRYGIVWYGMAWYGTVWYGTV